MGQPTGDQRPQGGPAPGQQQWQQRPQPPQQPQPYYSPAPGVPAAPQPPAYGGFQSGSYGGFGAFAEATPKRNRGRGKFVIAGIIALVLIAAGGAAAWQFGLIHFSDVLDEQALETGVKQVLTNNYGETDVTAVDCPSGQPVTSGHRFSCTVEISGATKEVAVRVLNGKPEFEVGAPH